MFFASYPFVRPCIGVVFLRRTIVGSFWCLKFRTWCNVMVTSLVFFSDADFAINFWKLGEKLHYTRQKHVQMCCENCGGHGSWTASTSTSTTWIVDRSMPPQDRTACDPGAGPCRDRRRNQETQRQGCKTSPATGPAQHPVAKAWRKRSQAPEAAKQQRRKRQWRGRQPCWQEAICSRSSARRRSKTGRMRGMGECKRIADNNLHGIQMPLLPGHHPEHRSKWEGKRQRALWQTVSRQEWCRSPWKHTHGGPVSMCAWSNPMQAHDGKWQSVPNHAVVRQVKALES